VRSAASVRLLSTAPKQPTLKERLAELIPAAQEKVRMRRLSTSLCCAGTQTFAIDVTIPHTGQGGPCSARKQVLWTRPRRPALWVRLTVPHTRRRLINH
jgi:hypothetical protein